MRISYSFNLLLFDNIIGNNHYSQYRNFYLIFLTEVSLGNKKIDILLN